MTSEQTLAFTHDGHGTERILSDLAAVVIQQFIFDAYGQFVTILSGSGAVTSGGGASAGLANAALALTSILYNGEYFEKVTNQLYLRARFYNPATGQFIGLDNFRGVVTDPQSLHKYLFTHGDPINGIDPSGEMTAVQLVAGTLIGALVSGIGGAAIGAIADGADGAIRGFKMGFFIGGAVTLGVLSGGAFVVAPLFAVSELTGIYILGTAVSAVFAGINIYDIATAQTPRQRAAAVAGLILNLSLWGYGTYRYTGMRAGRGTFENRNPAATPEEILVGRQLADELALDLVAQARQPGVETADYSIRLSNGQTIELKNATATSRIDNVAGRVRNAQSENVAVIFKDGQFDPVTIARLEGMVFSPRAPGPLGPGTVKTKTIIPVYETANGYVIGNPMVRH